MLKALIKELHEKDIHISLKNGRISYSGPEENITPELLDKIKASKGKLIKYLWGNNNTNFMPIQPEGNKVPLFLVHGDVGNYSLSEYLGPDQPVYGFFHPGSEGEEIHYKNVDEMAKAYLDKLLAFYPSGPFSLAGFSFGGILAFEMAIQLQQAGKKVKFLALIDSFSPLAKEPVVWEKTLYKILRSNILRPVKISVLNFLTRQKYRFYFFIKRPLPKEIRKDYIWDKYYQLTEKYRPQRFNGNLLLFKTKENRSTFKYLGWETLVDNVEIFDVEGKHTEIFFNKNSVEIIATKIGSSLLV